MLLVPDAVNSRLTLEVFHYVQKLIVDVWLILEPILHLIQIRESILHIQTMSTLKTQRRSTAIEISLRSGGQEDEGGGGEGEGTGRGGW
jgi:hypothetical protein